MIQLTAPVRRIIDGAGHPFSKLKELEQAGVFQAVVKHEMPTNTVSTVSISVTLLDGQIIHEQVSAVGLQAAKRASADRVLASVIHRGTDGGTASFPPSDHQAVSLNAPTKKQVRQIKEDATHLGRLCKVVENFLSGDTTVALLSIDCEQWERDTSITLEVGIAVVPAVHCLGRAQESIRVAHIINQDTLRVRNGIYCQDNRENFDFGVSRYVASEHLAQTVRNTILEMTAGYEKIYFVGHTTDSDKAWLQGMGLNMVSSMITCDIARAYRALTSPKVFVNITGMERILTELGIEWRFLHNGGNDAYYNLRVLEQMGIAIVCGYMMVMSIGI